MSKENKKRRQSEDETNAGSNKLSRTEEMTSPKIISHPESWTSPSGLCNPLNPLNF